jgi:tetratricopeptide (TPR) repeat protein
MVAAEAVGRDAVLRARPLGDARVLVKALNILAAALIGQGRYAEAREVADEALALARDAGDRPAQSWLVNTIGLIAMEQGDLGTAVEFFEDGLAMAREAGNRDDEGIRLNNLGSCYPRLGDYDQARRHLDDALELSRRTGQRATEALVLLNIASVAHLQGDETGSLAHANAAFDAAVETGQHELEAYARMVAGHAELALGRHDAAREAYLRSRDLLQSLKMRPQQVLDPVSGLARVALAQGRLDEAMAHVEPLLAHVAAGGTFDGTEEPLVLPLTCYRVLRAVGDPRADGTLATAVAELQAQAARIGDLRARRRFLERVPHHRELMAAWERCQDSAAEAAPQSTAGT